ncbi:hypothetical protein MMC18_009030 [Xylographa bjoerkii]|nr:hypothetical protein [Xylographa bjoerkii]
MSLLMPGYDSAMGVVKRVTGVDPTVILELCVLLAACSTLYHYSKEFMYSIIHNYCMTSAEIEGTDPVYAYLMRWMTIHQVTITSKTIKATAIPQNNEDDYQDTFETKPTPEPASSKPSQPANYRAQVDGAPIRFLPSGRYTFWYAGTFFIFQHTNIPPSQRSPSEFIGTHYSITLSCFSRSLLPIRILLRAAQTEFFATSRRGTLIFRPASAGGGSQLQWRQVLIRPARSLETVILDATKKEALLDDINEYLLPTTRQWYASHGIPYRRGYLLSGAPGTGKSSLTAALAGVFGLNIYSISLMDPDITESGLITLFATLPRRCITLFEDVDAAGLKRDGNPTVQIATRKRPGAAQQPVSLSALLNLIDGVASPEGRVLVLTSNFPETLEPALIRPGRVDMHVHFELATRTEIKDLFLAMYSDLNDASLSSSREMNTGGSADEEKKMDLEALAEAFTASIPEGMFSLASVQGHLLRWKREPQRAVEEVGGWCREVLGEGAARQGTGAISPR